MLYLLLVYNVIGVFRDLENLFCLSNNLHFSSDSAHFLPVTDQIRGIYFIKFGPSLKTKHTRQRLVPNKQGLILMWLTIFHQTKTHRL